MSKIAWAVLGLAVVMAPAWLQAEDSKPQTGSELGALLQRQSTHRQRAWLQELAGGIGGGGDRGLAQEGARDL